MIQSKCQRAVEPAVNIDLIIDFFSNFQFRPQDLLLKTLQLIPQTCCSKTIIDYQRKVFKNPADNTAIQMEVLPRRLLNT